MSVKQFVANKILNHKQKRNNKLYDEEGLTDKVLEKQIKINEYRNKYNVPDDNEVLTDDGFVQ